MRGPSALAVSGDGRPRLLFPVGRASAWRRLVARHRRLLVAVLVGAAALLGLSAVQPQRDTVTVLVAARDLPAGARLSSASVRRRAVPRPLLPAGVLGGAASVEGRQLTAPVRRGETLTDVRLVGRPLLDAMPPATVAVAVAPADPVLAGLLQPGDHVGLLTAASADGGSGTGSGSGSDGESAAPRLLVSDALVVSVPAAPATSAGGLLGSAPGTGAGKGPSVVLAVPRALAATTAAAAAADPLPMLLRSPRSGVP